MRKTLALVSVLSWSHVASADPSPPECSPDYPTRCSTPLRAGDRAPYAGQLLTPDLAIFLGQSTNAVDRRIRAAVTASTALERARGELALREMRADLRALTAERDLAREEARRPWIEHPIVVASIAVVATLGLCAAAIWGVDKLQDALE